MTAIVDWVVALPAPLMWLALLMGSSIEYVVPPFPGDAVVLAGSVVAGGQGLGFIPVFVATTVGSVFGAWLDFELGVWLAKPGDSVLHRFVRRPRVSKSVEAVKSGFSRHGDAYLLVNRFLPGVRAFFFLAAGLAGFSRRRMLVIAAVAAMLWNAAILVVGLKIGANIEALLAFGEQYAIYAWMAVGALAVALLTGYIVRRARGR